VSTVSSRVKAIRRNGFMCNDNLIFYCLLVDFGHKGTNK
jgi:hypothetical protein